MFDKMRLNNGLFFLLLLLVAACHKDEHITSDPEARLTLATSSVLFDTIFSSTGSVTKRIRISNENPNALYINEITLSGGTPSSFSLNINGEPTSSSTKIVLNGKDSLNIFVKVKIDPTADNLPFLVQDSIIINCNGHRQVIKLAAYGQNAIFINEKSITGDTSWSNRLPYVITGNITVQSGSRLNVASGAKIYFHKDASLNVEGVLNVEGSANDPVVFCSDRLESIYASEPGQWKGIFLKRTGNAVIKYAVIKNASVGITSDSLSQNGSSKLILSNSVIKNMQVAAYIGYHSEMLAFNNLMYNCGNYLVYATGGGRYMLKQNTFAGYNFDFPRKTAALTFSDYISSSAYNHLNIEMTNNIICGSLINELDIQRKSPATVDYKLLNNLIKTTKTDFGSSNLINVEPGFIAVDSENFQLQDNSIVIGKGSSLTNDPYYNSYLNKDLRGINRISPSTLGCYEKI